MCNLQIYHFKVYKVSISFYKIYYKLVHRIAFNYAILSVRSENYVTFLASS